MASFTYLVTVEVEDDLGGPTECYNEDYFDYCVTLYEEDGVTVATRLLYPETKADIIMTERLGYTEELNIGDYSLDWVRND